MISRGLRWLKRVVVAGLARLLRHRGDDALPGSAASQPRSGASVTPPGTTAAISEQIEHEFSVKGRPDIVREFLWDVEALVGCLPGCEEILTLEEKKRYKAHVRHKVGPFLIRMEMDIETRESAEDYRMTADIVGRDKRLKTEVRQRVTISVDDEAQDSSRVHISSQFELNGVLATLGWTPLSGHIYEIMHTFGANVQSAIEERQDQ